MKLADEVLLRGKHVFEDDTPESIASGILQNIERAVHVDINNIWHYLEQCQGNAYGDWANDFPCVTPPFEHMWFEYALPRTIEGQVVRTDRSGVLMSSTRSASGGFHVWMFMIVRARFSRDIRMWGMYSAEISPSGQIVPDSGMYYTQHDHIKGFPLPVFLAISFMHCKNVESREEPLSGKERRAFNRRHKRDPLRFHVLEIDPAKKVLESEGGVSKNGLRKALHICRGHFAHYTDDKPLFGKYTGTFWRPAHVRGSADAGTVYKDYRVKSGEIA